MWQHCLLYLIIISNNLPMPIVSKRKAWKQNKLAFPTKPKRNVHKQSTKQTLILVTATSTMFFLSRFRLLRPPSSSTSTEPRKCRRKTVPVAPTPNGSGFVLNTRASSKVVSRKFARIWMNTKPKNGKMRGFYHFLATMSLSGNASKKLTNMARQNKAIVSIWKTNYYYVLFQSSWLFDVSWFLLLHGYVAARQIKLHTHVSFNYTARVRSIASNATAHACNATELLSLLLHGYVRCFASDEIAHACEATNQSNATSRLLNSNAHSE